MVNKLDLFEAVVRKAYQFTDTTTREEGILHPFDGQNIHDKLPPIVKQLFDNGHYSQATFEAFKYIDAEVQRISGLTKSGTGLMMSVLGGDPPIVQLTNMDGQTKKDEQEGYKFLFSGALLAIRNPRGHVPDVQDSPDVCLDHLSLASLLLRRLEDSGYDLK